MRDLPRLKKGLLRHPLDGQTLVYDPSSEAVHLLDPTTACVLDLLTEGGWTSAGIIDEMTNRLGVVPDPSFLSLALGELKNADLLDGIEDDEIAANDLGRRDVIRKLAAGGLAMLVPAIATLAPSPAYAQGTGANIADGQPCIGTNGGSCAGGFCVTNTAIPTCCDSASKTGRGGSCTGNGGCCSGNCSGSPKTCQ